ncbi:MAG: IclR family transcriptional regulator domain-containing protein [Planctomycetota bacterium]
MLTPHAPLHDSAPGCLHLAMMAPAHRDATWARTGVPPAARPSEEALSRMRRDGYAAGPLASDEDVSLTAAAIYNHAGLCAGVISVAIPTSRHAKEPRAFRSVTLRAAADISAALGYVAG